MITLDEATRRASEALDNAEVADVRLFVELVVDSPSCWVFVVRREDGKSLFGNGPILVSKSAGRVTRADSSLPATLFVEAYEALGVERFEHGEWRQYLSDHIKSWNSTDD